MFDQTLAPHLRALVAEENALHEGARQAVRDEALERRQQFMRNEMAGLKELRDAAGSARTRDLPSILDQLHSTQMIAARRTQEPLPDMRAPYFAHLKIEDDQHQIRDLLIGHETFISSKHGITLIDWKQAPMAKVFFNYREGDSYEVELPSKTARGKILARRVIQFEKGVLTGIDTPQTELRLHPESKLWVEVKHSVQPELAGGQGSAIRSFGTGRTGERTADIAALLDEHQFRILQTDKDISLLVLGGAGSGKTTVAIHRLAHLFASDPQKFAQHKMLVVVPEEGLVRLSRKLLQSLKLDRVPVSTYDQWVYQQGTKVLPSLSKRLYRSAPPRVMRLKRNAAVLTVFPELAKWKQHRIGQQLKRELKPIVSNADEIFHATEASCLLKKIQTFAATIRELVPEKMQQPHAERILQTGIDLAISDLYDLSSDRIYLFSNRDLLEKIVAASQGALDQLMVVEVIRHMQDQITKMEGPSAKDLDPEYTFGIDEAEIETEDDEEELYNSIDVEDLTIMLELIHFYSEEYKGKNASLHKYYHLLLDEAQELSTLELGLLGNTLEDEGSITLAGDSLQQTDPTAVFSGWEDTVKSLGLTNVQSENLQTSYRCTEAVTKFAYEILGPQAVGPPPIAKRSGKPVLISRATSEGHASLMILETLEDLIQREPKASIAIIAADMENAKLVYRGLKDLAHIQLVRNGEFDFKPGIDVTDVSQIKGLEFDYVIIPDCDIYHYPDSTEHRRKLHVAVTRAIHQLWVIAPKVPSFILPKSALTDTNNLFV